MAKHAELMQETMRVLVDDCVASRINAKDAELYHFSENAFEYAQNFMGWATLAQEPPCDIAEIQRFADEVVADGISCVVLIGQGGSTQAAMTLTKYNKLDTNRVLFETIDSDSPVRLRGIFSKIDPAHTLFLVSSKSGSTLEPQKALLAVRKLLAQSMPEEEIPQHLVAITDPGSSLAMQAREESWRALFYGEPSVGGRYSALSVFGLLPAALVGINLENFMQVAREAEQACSTDSFENPAIKLAAFLYANYQLDRDKFSFLTPKRGRVLGLWIEQLVAESLGKENKGILPNIEVDSLLLRKDPQDRGIIMYETKNDLADETQNFLESLQYVDADIPQLRYKVDRVEQMATHFVMWEYAVAMCGYLMKVCPFDQPDVASAKAAVKDIFEKGMPEPQLIEQGLCGIPLGKVEASVSPVIGEVSSIEEALSKLFASVCPGDYCGFLVFLPFTGEGRREALEGVRHAIAKSCKIPTCLEIGPRYLHSTGQLHKGGPNKGIFLIISADEINDIEVDEHIGTLGMLAKAQALGDFETLSSRGRRCVHIHLPNNAGVTLTALTMLVDDVLQKLGKEK